MRTLETIKRDLVSQKAKLRVEQKRYELVSKEYEDALKSLTEVS